MFYKLYTEDGEYIDSTGNPGNLVECNSALTPEGVNCGWTEYDNIEQAIAGFCLSKKNKNKSDSKNDNQSLIFNNYL